MIIKLLSEQVPKFWEAIKFTAKTVDEVDEKDLPPVLNELLQALLSDKAQAFICMDEKRILKAILITRILIDKITGGKYLSMDNIYAWAKLSSEDYRAGYELVMKFAKAEDCKYIQGRSRHDHVLTLAKSIGFTQRFTVFDHRIE